ncbi:MAG TPA: 16S rRNA (cytosine(1402)-N(4))-methyltransferase RsmH [Candidatus Wallbacteria bacterium]|nr:16S rRNA (cytosine(1402)-N(4))-methyltransferase RsmH [Candidatus Wallbacteria bacterium]
MPVLLNEFLAGFAVLSESRGAACRDRFVDFTFGLGGHSLPLLEKYDWLKVTAFDADPLTIARAAEVYKNYVSAGRLTLVNGNFANFDSLISAADMQNVIGAIADFGISNYQLFEKGRGFSFDDDRSFDMRIDQQSEGPSAARVVNDFSEEELGDIFFHLADERLARQIARAVAERRRERPIETCSQFAEIVRTVYKRNPKVKTGVDFATKAVMALRIFVNSEFDNIKSLLEKAAVNFVKNSRLFTITFHSNEDRIVKEFIKNESRGCICPKEVIICRCSHKARVRAIDKKPLIATDAEMAVNPRSRSAKLRTIEFI